MSRFKKLHKELLRTYPGHHREINALFNDPAFVVDEEDGATGRKLYKSVDEICMEIEEMVWRKDETGDKKHPGG